MQLQPKSAHRQKCASLGNRLHPPSPPPLGTPLDQVMINLTKQDLEFKREIVKQLKETDDDRKQQLKAMAETVGSLSNSISEGFLALTSCLNNQSTFLVPRHQDPPFPTLPVNTQLSPRWRQYELHISVTIFLDTLLIPTTKTSKT